MGRAAPLWVAPSRAVPVHRRAWARLRTRVRREHVATRMHVRSISFSAHCSLWFTASPSPRQRPALVVMVMSAENRALCYLYRNPPPGSNNAPLRWATIARLVWNEDGKTHPKPCSVRKCVLGWRRERKMRGRRKGSRKTTAAEDTAIKACFQKARPPQWER